MLRQPTWRIRPFMRSVKSTVANTFDCRDVSAGASSACIAVAAVGAIRLSA